MSPSPSIPQPLPPPAPLPSLLSLSLFTNIMSFISCQISFVRLEILFFCSILVAAFITGIVTFDDTTLCCMPWLAIRDSIKNLFMLSVMYHQFYKVTDPCYSLQVTFPIHCKRTEYHQSSAAFGSVTSLCTGITVCWFVCPSVDRSTIIFLKVTLPKLLSGHCLIETFCRISFYIYFSIYLLSFLNQDLNILLDPSSLGTYKI